MTAAKNVIVKVAFELQSSRVFEKRNNFIPVKSGKRSGFVFDLYLKDNAFAAVRSDAKF